jgi:recombination protein RecA
MPSASSIRLQIESALAKKIPSALTPAPQLIRRVLPSGISSIDDLLDGGLPVGAITEIIGSECSGRTSFALSFIAQMTQAEKVCAWVDVSNTLHPESAAAAGVTLNRLLWVRCGVPAVVNMQRSTLYGFTFPEKPVEFSVSIRDKAPMKEVYDAVSDFLHPEMIVPRCAEPQRRIMAEKETFQVKPSLPGKSDRSSIVFGKPWTRIEHALRATDLLLQTGGFSAIVLDMGSVAPEHGLRVPMATWFRCRAAAERTQTSILLLTQHVCAKSSAGLVLCLQSSNALQKGTTVFAGIEHQAEILRQRFVQNPSNIVPLRKCPQRADIATWQTCTTWVGRR